MGYSGQCVRHIIFSSKPTCRLGRPYKGMKLLFTKVREEQRPCSPSSYRTFSKRILLVMKLTTFLLLIALTQISAKSFSQTITITGNNISLGKVFRDIHKQTGYHFLSTKEQLLDSRKVDVNLKKVPLNEGLRSVFKGQPLTYRILDKTIIVKRKANNVMKYRSEETLPETISIEGTVKDSITGDPLVGVTIKVKGGTVGTTTDVKGKFSLEVPKDAVLEVSYVGYKPQEISTKGKTDFQILLVTAATGLNQLVVVGFGEQKKKNITSSISNISAKDIEKVDGGATISSKLAGKLSGLSFRQAEGRPGSGATINIRNMGAPLYVIDGVIENKGRFDQLDPNDIQSISILKDASAASVYGVQAGNGVVVIETKKGRLNTPLRVNVKAYRGWQNLTRYPNNVVDAYHWQLYAADAQMNSNGTTGITRQDIQNWKEAKSPEFQSFDWPAMIFRKNAPQTALNIDLSGGSEKTNYYLSFSRFKQDAVFKEYQYDRYNVLSNVETRIGKENRLKLGVSFRGKIEDRLHPGIPGLDDYMQPLNAAMRNRPMFSAFANNNPKYLNDIGFNNTNAGLWTFERSGKYQDRWWALATRFSLSYNFPVKGLSAKASFNYTYEDNLLTNHEKRYKAYTYHYDDSTYEVTNTKPNAWQERGTQKNFRKNFSGQINYSRLFKKHNLKVLLATVWLSTQSLKTHIHSVPPTDVLDQFIFNTIDDNGFLDANNKTARIGYIGRIKYNYADRYYLELSGRQDGSWKFPKDNRWGFFPAFSAGWRLSSEPFLSSSLGQGNIINDLKLRVSYGVLGDDDIGIGPYAYVPGYNFGIGNFIVDGQSFNMSGYRGLPVTNITWFTSNMFNIGLDFSLWDNKFTGSIEYFNRKRKGLLAKKYDLLLPSEIGYQLPEENLNSDEVFGGDIELSYNGDLGNLHYEIFGNVNYARKKMLHNYKPRYGNSWDKYRNATEERLKDIFWGYEVKGQFQSIDQINNYSVDVDGRGNTTLLPGDLIYKDVNGDGIINEMDMRPIGFNKGGQPIVYGGFGFNLRWRSFDFAANFSFGGGYTIVRDGYAKISFLNNGNLLKDYTDRWHREDPLDLNSKWIPGKDIPLRFNDGSHSNYRTSSYWVINARYLRSRSISIGYTLPKDLTKKVSIQRARIFVDTDNLLTFDNVKKQASFIDPEIKANNAIQYPQSKFINVGIKLTF